MFDDFYGSDFEGFVNYTEGLSEGEFKSNSMDYENYGSGRDYYIHSYSETSAKKVQHDKPKQDSPVQTFFKTVGWAILMYIIFKWILIFVRLKYR